MDIQFYGANCISVTQKGLRIVVDDNLSELGAKSVLKTDDVALFTNPEHSAANVRLTFDGPGEYEVADVSIIGIPARSHMDEAGQYSTTMFKIVTGELSVLVTGHIHPDISDNLLETIGLVDLMIIPVGGSGYTLDPVGALKVIKEVEPKLVVPTHYEEKGLHYPVPQIGLAAALHELSMEPKERVAKLRVKPSELSDVTQLIVLEKS